MANYFSLPTPMEMQPNNFFDLIIGYRKDTILQIESNLKPKFPITQAKLTIKSNSVDSANTKKQEALAAANEIINNIQSNFYNINNFPHSAVKDIVFEHEQLHLDWQILIGGMTESQTAIELAQLNAKKTILDNTQSFWQDSLNTYKIGGDKWNEAKDLYFSAFDTEAEAIVSWKSAIKDSIFNIYQSLRGEEIYYLFTEKTLRQSDKLNTASYKDSLLAERLTIREGLVSQMDTLNVEKVDSATTSERIAEIDVELANLQSQIDSILAEETDIVAEFNLSDLGSDKKIEYFDLKGSAIRQVANQLEDFIMDNYAYYESNIGQYKLGNKETVQMLASKFYNRNVFHFPIPEDGNPWGNLFDRFNNPDTGNTYFGDLMNLFDSREVAVNNYNAYTETLKHVYGPYDFFWFMSYTKKAVLTQELYFTKVTQFTDAVAAKQAQIDAETDETLLATYQEELTKLTNALNNFTSEWVWEDTNGDQSQAGLLDTYNNIKTQIDNLSTEIFNIDLQISYLINKINIEVSKINIGTSVIDQYVVANWPRITDFGSYFGWPQYMNYLENITGSVIVDDPSTY